VAEHLHLAGRRRQHSCEQVHSTGMLPYGTADMITGGVFIVYGVHAKRVEHFGDIATYGVNDMVLDTWGTVDTVNDMVLDTWGTVDTWIAHAPVVSYGPSGIGFVNFGTVDEFHAEAEIVTYGLGARGFNQYDGTVRSARFKSIETFGDGSIGIQVSKPVGTITVDEDVTTHGSIGNTLVKGVTVLLPAEAFSVKPGGVVEKLGVGGSLVTHGAKVTTYAVEGGKVLAVDIKGEVLANGEGSDAVLVADKGSTPLTNVRASAKAGKALREADGEITDRTGFLAGYTLSLSAWSQMGNSAKPRWLHVRASEDVIDKRPIALQGTTTIRPFTLPEAIAMWAFAASAR